MCADRAWRIGGQSEALNWAVDQASNGSSLHDTARNVCQAEGRPHASRREHCRQRAGDDGRNVAL